jgi:hypothetical protein
MTIDNRGEEYSMDNLTLRCMVVLTKVKDVTYAVHSITGPGKVKIVVYTNPAAYAAGVGKAARRFSHAAGAEVRLADVLVSETLGWRLCGGLDAAAFAPGYIFAPLNVPDAVWNAARRAP